MCLAHFCQTKRCGVFRESDGRTKCKITIHSWKLRGEKSLKNQKERLCSCCPLLLCWFLPAEPVSNVDIKSNVPDAIEYNSTVILTCSAIGSSLSFKWINGSVPIVVDGTRITEIKVSSTLIVSALFDVNLWVGVSLLPESSSLFVFCPRVCIADELVQRADHQKCSEDGPGGSDLLHSI